MSGRSRAGAPTPRRRPTSPGAGPDVRFLLHGAERSGPPIYLLRLLRQWARVPPGFETEVVVARPGELLADFAAVTTTRVARLDRVSPERVAERAFATVGLGGAGRRLSVGATRARVGGHAADITVVNGATAPTVELLRRLRPVGTVLTIAHELSTGWFGNLTAADRSLLLDRTSDFLAVSASVERFLIDELGVDAHAVHVVHPPVEVGVRSERPPAVAHDPVVVAGSGMTDWRKAPELWLRVAAGVMARRPEDRLRFMWVGGDRPGSPAFWPLRHELRHLGLEGHVEFLGQIDAPDEIIGSASVFVSTAREDAYPLACAEAMSLGVPVVGFDVDGVAEMVRESGGGTVVAYPDLEELADRVAELLGDRRARDELGRRGASFARSELDSSVIAPAVANWIAAARQVDGATP